MSSSILQQIVPRDNNSVSSSRQHDASSANVVPNVTRNINKEFPGVSLKSSKPITRIVTSKKWVLPPRPKPGRKPSADVPTTKRKAQNRAAQRHSEKGEPIELQSWKNSLWSWKERRVSRKEF